MEGRFTGIPMGASGGSGIGAMERCTAVGWSGSRTGSLPFRDITVKARNTANGGNGMRTEDWPWKRIS